jgi:hypothetical protein
VPSVSSPTAEECEGPLRFPKPVLMNITHKTHQLQQISFETNDKRKVPSCCILLVSSSLQRT